MNTAENVDQYIGGYPDEVQVILKQIRETIKKAAPDAFEGISYGMPSYKLNGILVYFAGHTKHIGFYPAGQGIEQFIPELVPYKYSKGTIQFPYNQPLPIELITRMVEFRVAQNLNKPKKK